MFLFLPHSKYIHIVDTIEHIGWIVKDHYKILLFFTEAMFFRELKSSQKYIHSQRKRQHENKIIENTYFHHFHELIISKKWSGGQNKYN